MRLVMVLIAAQRIMASEVWVAFVVAGEAAVGGEPGQGALDAPAAWNDGEAALAFQAGPASWPTAFPCSRARGSLLDPRRSLMPRKLCLDL